MRSFVVSLAFLIVIIVSVKGQTTTTQTATATVLTEADRKFLLDNLNRTKAEIIQETKDLTKAQWNFKESTDRWSINQVVEHIAIWELLILREISQALVTNPDPNFAYATPDSVFLNGPKSSEKRNALEYTKPFSFAVPLGNNEGQHNVTWFLTMRNESIEYLKAETKNIRLHYDYCTGMSVYQYYLMIFGHTDRHLIQIRKVKAHRNYPKK